MKKIPLIIFMIVPYLVFALDITIPLVCGSLTADAVEMMVILTFLCCFPLMLVSAIVYGALMKAVGFKPEESLFWAMLLKLMNVPLFIAISIMVILFLMMFFSAPLGITLALSSYLLILPTSVIAQFAFIRAEKNSLLNTGETVVSSIGLWFVVLDLVAVIYTYFAAKRKLKVSSPSDLTHAVVLKEPS